VSRTIKEWEDEVVDSARKYANEGYNASALLALCEDYPRTSPSLEPSGATETELALFQVPQQTAGKDDSSLDD